MHESKFIVMYASGEFAFYYEFGPLTNLCVYLTDVYIVVVGSRLYYLFFLYSLSAAL